MPNDCLTRAHLLPLYHQYFLTFNTIITVNITIIFIIIHHWSFWSSKSTRSRISLSTLTIQINKWINIPVSNDYPCIGSHWNDVKSLQITLKSVTKLFPTFAQKGIPSILILPNEKNSCMFLYLLARSSWWTICSRVTLKEQHHLDLINRQIRKWLITKFMTCK